MKSEKEKPVVRFYFSNSHEPDYHPNHNVPLQDEGYLYAIPRLQEVSIDKLPYKTLF